jgi:hypothetical protein
MQSVSEMCRNEVDESVCRPACVRSVSAELGIVAAQGDAGVNALRAIVADDRDVRLPIDARASVGLCAVISEHGITPDTSER